MSDDYRVRNADWMDGYRAGYRQAQREADPPPRCEVDGCERIPLLDPDRRRCREHREAP